MPNLGGKILRLGFDSSISGGNGSAFQEPDDSPEQWEGKRLACHHACFRRRSRELAYIIIFQWLATMGAQVGVPIITQFLTTLRTFGFGHNSLGGSGGRFNLSSTFHFNLLALGRAYGSQLESDLAKRDASGSAWATLSAKQNRVKSVNAR